MNRVAVVLNSHGEIARIVADAPVEVLIVDPNAPADRVYSYQVGTGPHLVRQEVGGFAVGHAADGRLGEGDGTGRRPPSRPSLTLVPLHATPTAAPTHGD